MKLIILFGLFATWASTYGLVYSQVLNQHDIDFQRFDNSQGVALGSSMASEHPWGSYNQWQCFKIKDVSFDCAYYDYGTLVPSIRVATGSEIFLFDTYVENRLDCRATLSVWRDLSARGNELCIFGAHMPDVDLDADEDKPMTLWYIRRVKGMSGYWDLFESSPEYSD